MEFQIHIHKSGSSMNSSVCKSHGKSADLKDPERVPPHSGNVYAQPLQLF